MEKGVKMGGMSYLVYLNHLRAVEMHGESVGVLDPLKLNEFVFGKLGEGKKHYETMNAPKKER